MDIPAGTRLGAYEIVAELGAGGMGKVYKALDRRLDRTVAIKVMSAPLNGDQEAKARFEREARAIAQMQHPHICTLYDVGDQETTAFLVMEYLEGESLAERLRRGPLPIDQLLKLGIEISGALDLAHRAGIVHRDLKPGNIMLTKAGAKLLDFGLAKPKAAAISGSAPMLSAAVTLSSPVPGVSPLTTAGTVLGTIQYMSPEQIEGKEVDARSDIFALGAVLYQGATGKPPFEGKSQISVATAILEKEPEPLANLQPAAPAELKHIIQTCLAKDPEARFQCARDVGIELQWIATKPPEVAVASNRPGRIALLLWVVIPLLTLAAAAAGYWFHRPRSFPLVRSEISFADDMMVTDEGNFAISPDGSKLAVAAQTGGGKPALWIRSLSSLKPRRVDDTDDAKYPFWSPDSRYLGFFAHGQLRKLDTNTFVTTTISPAEDGRGGTWNANNVIVFAPNQTGPLFRISADGGEPTAVTKTDEQDQTHRWPRFLPDGDHLIYVSKITARPEGRLMGTSLSQKQPKEIVESSGDGFYSNGYLLYLKNHNLTVQSFDPKSLALIGTARILVENIASTGTIRFIGDFSVSSTGMLVYRSEGPFADVQLAWTDSNGNKLANVGEPGPYENIVLSPDGKRVLLGIRDSQTQNQNYWMMDVQRGVVTRFTFDPQFDDVNAQWSYDGKFILFSSNRVGGHYAVYRKAVDGTEPEQLLMSQPDGNLLATAITLDGRLAAAYNATSRRSWIFSLASEQKPYQFLEPETQIIITNWSPDGRWILFTSTQTGRRELYISDFPHAHGRWQISSDGAFADGVRRDGKKISYTNSAYRIVTVDFDGSGPNPHIGKPEVMFGGKTLDDLIDLSVTPDWKHFLAGFRSKESSLRLTLVNNWTSELEK
jgi:serine/threonine protein kinase